MSLKVYDGWRFPQTKAKEFTESVYPQIMTNVVERVAPTMMLMNRNVVGETVSNLTLEEIQSEPGAVDIEQATVIDIRWDEREKSLGRDLSLIVDEKARAVSPLRKKNNWNLECGYNLFPHNNHFYVIPYGPSWTTKTVEMPDFVEDYKCWNNTDKPDDISREEWDERMETWQSILPYWPMSKEGPGPMRFPVIDYPSSGVDADMALDRFVELLEEGETPQIYEKGLASERLGRMKHQLDTFGKDDTYMANKRIDKWFSEVNEEIN